MEYQNEIAKGTFLRRPNRFLAEVACGEECMQVHVKNTGRCRELLQEGAVVYLEKSNHPNRKTQYSLIAVCKGERLVNLDAQAPNAVAAEALAEGRITELGAVCRIRQEVRFGSSRFDLYYEAEGRKGFVEVKGVTLEEAGIAMFPDAPTKRGAKHLAELVSARQQGYEAAALFLVQMQGVHAFCPNTKRDAVFAQASQDAAQAGVRILAYDCRVWERGLQMNHAVPVRL